MEYQTYSEYQDFKSFGVVLCISRGFPEKQNWQEIEYEAIYRGIDSHDSGGWGGLQTAILKLETQGSHGVIPVWVWTPENQKADGDNLSSRPR